MDISDVTWRKASYSGDNGGACIEVGIWRKATHSGGNGGECIDVASADKSFIAVRDSKDPNGPNLAFTKPIWQSLVQRLKGTGLGLG